MRPRIKIRHLMVFVEVARRRSVSEAAQAMFVTQSAASRSLTELENLLGTSLFLRGKRKFPLTRIGETFLRHAEQALAALRQGEETVAQALQGGRLQINLGALPYIAARFVPPAVGAFMRENPALVVRVLTAYNAVMLTMLKNGELDLVIGRLANPQDMDGVVFEHLYSDRLALAARAGHPLLKKRRPGGRKGQQQALRELDNHTVVFLPPGTSVRDQADRVFIESGVPLPTRRVETEDAALARGMVQDGAVWCVPVGIVESDLKAGTLGEIPVNMESSAGTVGMSVRAGIPVSPHCAALMEKVREATASARDGGI